LDEGGWLDSVTALSSNSVPSAWINILLELHFGVANLWKGSQERAAALEDLTFAWRNALGKARGFLRNDISRLA